jgi:phosphoribosylformylglycinamidine cyclo-ligase
MGLTYRQAGVDIDRGDELVERIKPLARMTRIPEVLADVGGFAGLCAIPAGIVDPILVSGTDGVGTKLKLAFQTGVHNTIGQDLVGMCVNDVLTCGARPLFFLDYFATGRLDIDVAESVVRGIANACKEVGCALIGGETAELPGMYADGEYDLAGFALGVVGRASIIDGKSVRAGDRVLCLGSSGLHSNGYSLARAVVDRSGASLDSAPPELGGSTLAQALLAPTRLYARHTAAVLAAGVRVHAMSHITGGGLPGNLPRVLPEGLGAEIEGVAPPAIFSWIKREGGVEASEMLRTFNCGVGFAIIVHADDENKAREALAQVGEQVACAGTIVAMPESTPFEERCVVRGAVW